MTTDIETWTDGYLVLRQRAIEARGLVDLDGGASWPRTTGEDVIAIAALFDAALKEHATPGTAARWAAALADLETGALTSPHTTYFANRAFWSTLEIAAIYLDSVEAMVPAQPIWNALLGAVGAHGVRNAGSIADGPFKHFDNVKTFDDLYIEQFKYLRDLRGFDKVPADASGSERVIPRTTNGDVIALADYWSKQLASAPHVMGYDGVAKEWLAAVADVGQIARKGDASAVYAKNNAFWRTLQRTAIQVAAANEAPTKLDIAKDALKETVAHLPESIEHAVTGAAQAVGSVAQAAGKGLFQGFGTPLLIGGGLLGLFLITRNRGGTKEA